MAKKKKKKTKPKAKAGHEIRWDRQPLGKISDRQIAKKLGVEPGIVRHQRMRLGIPIAESSRFALTKGIDWDNEGRLGKMCDTHLGKELGVTGAAVRKARQRRDIPLFGGYRRPRKSTPVKKKRRHRSPIGVNWDKEPLGKMPDTSIAILLDCASQSVFKARQDRGIPAYRKKRGVTWTDG